MAPLHISTQITIGTRLAPTPSITSFTSTPPTDFRGTGMDGSWGAGFLAPWTKVKLTFQNTRTLMYWNPSTHNYDLPSPPDIFATITGGLGTIGPGTTDFPSYQMTWDGTAFLPDNYPIGQYSWNVVLLDGDTRCQEQAPNPVVFGCTRNNPCM
jgi:hypothetical protein